MRVYCIQYYDKDGGVHNEHIAATSFGDAQDYILYSRGVGISAISLINDRTENLHSVLKDKLTVDANELHSDTSAYLFALKSTFEDANNIL